MSRHCMSAECMHENMRCPCLAEASGFSLCIDAHAMVYHGAKLSPGQTAACEPDVVLMLVPL